MKTTKTTTTTATETATAREYKNRFNLTAFQYGETITTDTGKLYLTAVNCAISINRIKRDLTQNLTIHKWLNELDTALSYAWNNIDENGIIHLFDGNRKEDTEDAIQTCVLALMGFIGQPYSVEIQKQVRNAYGREIDNKSRTADSLLTEDIDTATETTETAYRPIYDTDTDFHNANLIKAIKSCDFSETDIDILVRVANGESQGSIAEDIGVSRPMINKRYRKMIKALQTVMVK